MPEDRTGGKAGVAERGPQGRLGKEPGRFSKQWGVTIAGQGGAAKYERTDLGTLGFTWGRH